MKKWISEIKEAQKKPVVILSSHNVALDENTNISNYNTAYRLLVNAGMNFQPAKSVYKGDKEPCFLCLPRDDKDYKYIEWLADLLNQECILLRANGKVEYIYLSDGSSDIIGSELVQVSREIAEKEEGYTVIDTPLSGRQYYIVK